MSYGYSQSLVRANKTASAKSLGVALGRICIGRDIAVQSVADVFGVSRMTVYNWFKGLSNPHPLYADAIKSYIKKHSKK